MGSDFPHHTSENSLQSTIMLENITSSTVPSSRFWMPIPRFDSVIMQLSKSTRAMRSIFSEPILTAHEREVMMQLVTTTSSHGPYSSNSLRFLRHMQSSPLSMKQFEIRTLREWSISMPSPLRTFRLLSSEILEIATS